MNPTIRHERTDVCSLDVLNLNELTERCMGNLEFAERILMRFQGSLESDLAEIAQAATMGDLEHVAQIAHRIKGAAANVAAKALLKVASEIESAANRQDADTVWSRLPILGAERNRLVRCIPRFTDPISTN